MSEIESNTQLVQSLKNESTKQPCKNHDTCRAFTTPPYKMCFKCNQTYKLNTHKCLTCDIKCNKSFKYCFGCKSKQSISETKPQGTVS